MNMKEGFTIVWYFLSKMLLSFDMNSEIVSIVWYNSLKIAVLVDINIVTV